MTDRNKSREPVEIFCQVRQDDPSSKTLGIWAGEMEWKDGRERERWVFIPRSLIQQIEAKKDGMVITIPQWLAEDRRLV